MPVGIYQYLAMYTNCVSYVILTDMGNIYFVATRVPTSEQPTQPTDTPAVPTNMTDKSAAHIVLNTTTLVLLMCSVVLSLI